MEPWFDAKTAGMIGALIGGILGLTGALTIFTIAIAAGVLLIITGITAAANEQPYHVWYSFFFPGFIGTAIFSSLFPVVRKRFTESELRQMQAKDL